jgi:hypothetical protein
MMNRTIGSLALYFAGFSPAKIPAWLGTAVEEADALAVFVMVAVTVDTLVDMIAAKENSLVL